MEPENKGMDSNHNILSTPYCLPCTTVNNNTPIALNTGEDDTDDFTDFGFGNTEFGTDNCATHHICSDIRLFVKGTLKPLKDIGVVGVSGKCQAEGMGTVVFDVIDDQGIRNKITLERVIYLPSSSKNLISISQWSNDKGDDCGVISRGEYSLFMWDHDSKQKFIPHNPECKIPIMQVNEGDGKFTSFLSTIDDKLMDKVCLL